MDLLKELGPLALGSRLKRLSDQLMQDGIRIYKETGVTFEPKWFPVYYLLNERGPSSVTEIAKGLGITHPSVNQVAREMIAADLVAAYKDRKDKRKRVLALTTYGKNKHTELAAIWRDINGALQSLLDETQVDFLGYIGTMERALEKQSFQSRFEQHYEATSLRDQVEIVCYTPHLAPAFKAINEAWIGALFELETIDKNTLDNPESVIIDPGGEILFALDKQSQQVLGTCALINHGHGRIELSKMGVEASSQNKGVGKQLVRNAIDWSRNHGFAILYLETNSRLAPALGLYGQAGFIRKTAPKISDYARSDVYMELMLK